MPAHTLPGVQTSGRMHLQDEDVLKNVLVKPDVYQRYHKMLRNCFLHIVEGTIHKQSGILNVLAEAPLGI